MALNAQREIFHIDEKQLREQIQQLIYEGNVRRITFRQNNAVRAEFPLTVGVVAALLSPIAAAAGILLALLNDCRIEIERVEPAPHGLTKPIYRAQLVEAPDLPNDHKNLTDVEQWLQEQAIEFTD